MRADIQAKIIELGELPPTSEMTVIVWRLNRVSALQKQLKAWEERREELAAGIHKTFMAQDNEGLTREQVAAMAVLNAEALMRALDQLSPEELAEEAGDNEAPPLPPAGELGEPNA